MSNVIYARCASCNNVIKGEDQSIISCPYCFKSTPVFVKPKTPPLKQEPRPVPAKPVVEAAPAVSPLVEKMVATQQEKAPYTIPVEIADNLFTSVTHLTERYQAAWVACHIGQILNIIGAMICVFATFVSIAEAPRFIPLFISGAIATIPVHVFFSIGKMVADIASRVCKAD